MEKILFQKIDDCNEFDMLGIYKINCNCDTVKQSILLNDLRTLYPLGRT